MRRVAKWLAVAALTLSTSTAWAQITGPETVKAGELVHLTMPAPAGSDVVFEVIDPSELDFIEYKDGTTAHFICPAGCSARKIKVLALSINFDTKMLKRERFTVTVDGNPTEPEPPPVPPSKVSQVTVVYEKSQVPVPRDVQAELSRLTQSKGIPATEFERDSKTAGGGVPKQYQIANAAAKDKRLPCAVIQYADGRVVVIENPKASDIAGVAP